ncbi:proline dehydrogenase family protein [Oceanobacillus bengalensis]|uniref:proline dehydrogenase n=1 Tax=Oceanobacillus bengalensis TaxID=1435466 RepID=A0A494YYZ3_9BACI|nr:proline dehydrogenase family protein [Oceanobacillus bengalensis]RKQ14929.1 proline dehydrogenase [Oceanobacillus bengalensis]
MANLTKDLFIGLSNNKFLNENAKRWGFRLGANKFVAGTNIDSVIETIRELNGNGIRCTLDNLGEFVADKAESTQAKEEVLRILDVIHSENLDCHLSVKLTQLGLDIDHAFCVANMREILRKAKGYDLFVNIDMEDYSHYPQTLDVLYTLLGEYDNVGTVVQSYLFRTEEDLEDLKKVRLRLVKGAYKESEDVAWQKKEEIDRSFILLAKKRLLGEAFTSIATHDHNIINELKRFIEENKISRDMFEFQMLYGFRTEMQFDLAKEGFNFCTYIPFGNDWFGYFMRRLAERPQNLNLVMKDVFYTKDNQLKKEPIITGAVAASLLLLWRKKKKTKSEKVVQ